MHQRLFSCVDLDFNLCLQRTINNSLIWHSYNSSLYLWMSLTAYYTVTPFKNKIVKNNLKEKNKSDL